MKFLKWIGRVILISILTAALLFTLLTNRLTRDQLMFDAGRKYERNQTTKTGAILPNGVTETGYPNLTYRYRDSSE